MLFRSQRISQTFLKLPYIGPFLSALSAKLPLSWAQKLHHQQLSSIYSSSADATAMEEDINDMFYLMQYKGGSRLVHKTISYLNDRQGPPYRPREKASSKFMIYYCRWRFESRWFRALRNLNIPCLVLWADSDAVAPMDIAKYLATNVLPSRIFTGKYLQNVGHFLMLEKPQEWSQIVADFILNKVENRT